MPEVAAKELGSRRRRVHVTAVFRAPISRAVLFFCHRRALGALAAALLQAADCWPAVPFSRLGTLYSRQPGGKAWPARLLGLKLVDFVRQALVRVRGAVPPARAQGGCLGDAAANSWCLVDIPRLDARLGCF